VAVLVLAVHWPVLSAQALSLDDNQYLTGNPLVQSPSWASARRFLTEVMEPSTVRGYYQPLAMISLMLDYAAGGRPEDLAAFHRTSLALHVLNTGLVVTLLYLLLGRAWVAGLAGLLFGVHPLTVEPVAWLTERKTLLAAFFSLACLVCYVLYTRRPNWGRYLLCAVTLVLALLSKPTSTPLPMVMLLLDYWPLRRLSRRAALEKVPLFLIAGVAAVITVLSQSRTAILTSPGSRPLFQTALILCHNIVFYLYKAVWPVQVSGNYAFPSPLSPADPMVLAGLIGTGLLIPLLLVLWRWTRALLTGWLIFFLAILPTMGILGFTNVIAADKFAYLPSIGLLLILAWALGHLWGTGPVRRGWRWRPVATVAAVLACAALAAAGTRAHLAYWRDSIGLYRHMLAVDPDSATAQYNLGLLLVKRGEHAEAAEHFAATLRLNPRHDKAHRELGLALERLGHLDEAVAHYQEALRINPDFLAAHLNMAVILMDRGDFDAAMTHCQAALRIDPNDYFVQDNLGRAYFKQGDYQTAAEHYRQALRIRPNYGEAHHNLGLTLWQLGRLDEAREAFRQAVQLDPSHSRARQALEKLGPADASPSP
jgi:Flp pilus assembly protein TadD